MDILGKIYRIERIDQLIRMKATGTPVQLAKRLETSERTIYDIIKLMKKIGAPIYYCRYRKSYCYRKDVNFSFGFTLIKNETYKLKTGRRF